MPAPGEDYINQAIDAVVAALKAHPAFMAAGAPGAPAGARGVVRCVERNLPDTTTIPKQRLPHAGVIWLRNSPTDDGARGGDDEQLEIGIQLYHRGTDRDQVWSALQQAAAAIKKVAQDEMAGGRLDGFATLIKNRGGMGIDTTEVSGFGGRIPAGLILTVRIPYDD